MRIGKGIELLGVLSDSCIMINRRFVNSSTTTTNSTIIGKAISLPEPAPILCVNFDSLLFLQAKNYLVYLYMYVLFNVLYTYLAIYLALTVILQIFTSEEDYQSITTARAQFKVPTNNLEDMMRRSETSGNKEKDQKDSVIISARKHSTSQTGNH